MKTTFILDLKLMDIPFLIYLCFHIYLLAFIAVVFLNFSYKAGPSGNLSIASTGYAGLKSGTSLLLQMVWLGCTAVDQ